MATIGRIRVRWEGFFGAPGVSTFYCLSPATFRPGLVTFFNSIGETIPTAASTVVESSGDLVDDTTGLITGAWADGAEVTKVGTVAGQYAGPVGAVINWQTTRVIVGRRLRGKTFIVPLGGGSYDTNGTLFTATRTAITDAAAALIAAAPGQMVVLHKATPTTPTRVATDWESAAVATSSVPDLTAVLRSRRG